MATITRDQMLRDMRACMIEDYAIFEMMPGEALKAPTPTAGVPATPKEDAYFKRHAYRAMAPPRSRHTTCKFCHREYRVATMQGGSGSRHPWCPYCRGVADH